MSRVAWTADPDRLVVIDNTLGVKLVSVRTGKVKRLLARYVVSSAQLAAGGKTVVFSGRPAAAGSPSDDLLEVSIDGGGLRQLTETSSVSETGAAVSPDDRHIAYSPSSRAGPRPGQQGGIWIVDRDGSNPRRLTASDDTGPAWAPDSGHIVFTRRPADRNRINALALWVTDLAGRGATPVVDTHPPLSAAAWSASSRGSVPVVSPAAKTRFIEAADRICASFGPRYAAVDASARTGWRILDRFPPSVPAPHFDTAHDPSWAARLCSLAGSKAWPLSHPVDVPRLG